MTETEALKKYDAFLWKHVHAFYRSARCQTIPLDDFIQEARLTFLQHIRTHEESEWAACTLTIKGALYDLVRRAYPLKVSRHRFSKTIRERLSFGTVECHAEELLCEDDHTDIDLWMHLAGLTEEERQIVVMRLEAMTLDEIGKRLGASRQVIGYRLKAIRRKMVA